MKVGFCKKILFFCLFFSNTIIYFGQKSNVQKIDYKPDTVNIENIPLDYKRVFLEKLSKTNDSSLYNKYKFESPDFSTQKIEIEKLENIGKGRLLNPKIKYKNITKPIELDFEGFRMIDRGNYPLARIDIEDNLYYNHISKITQDKRGKIWIGYTSGAVSKLTNNSIINYSHSNGFPSDIVADIIEYNSKIYIATFGGGLFIVDVRNNAITNLNKDNGFSTNHLTSFCIDGNNNLWISTFSDGLIKYNEENFYIYNDKLFEGATTNFNKIIYDSTTQLLWTFDSNNNLFNIDKNGYIGKCKVLQQNKPNKILDISVGDGINILYDKNRIANLKEDKLEIRTAKNLNFNLTKLETATSGNIWSSSSTGEVLIFHKNNNKYNVIGANSGSTKLPIMDIFFDRNSSVWVGTLGDGIYHSYPSNFRTIITDADNYFKSGSVLSSNKELGLVFTGAKNQIINMSPNYNLTVYKSNKINRVTGILALEKSIFISSFNGLYEISSDSLFIWKHSSKSRAEYNSNTGIYLANKKIIVNNYNYGWFETDLNLKNWKYHNPLKNITETTGSFYDSKNRLWFKNTQTGIFYVKNNKLITITNKIKHIKSYAEDSLGNIYIGTGEGLFVFTNNNELKQIKWESDLTLYNINNIVYDSTKNGIWFGSIKNLIFLDLEKLSTQFYTKVSGIKGSYFTKDGSAKSYNRNYWSTNKGIVEYTPHSFNVEQRPPEIKLQKIYVNSNDISLEFQKERKKIEYTSIKNEIPQDLSFYKETESVSFILGADVWHKDLELAYYYSLNNQDWKGPYQNSEIKLLGFSIGKQELRIKAVNVAQIESNIITYNFEVKQHFYENSWFLIGVILLFVFSSLYFYVRRASFKISQVITYSYSEINIKRLRFLVYTYLFGFPFIEYINGVLFELVPFNIVYPLISIVLGINFLIFSYTKGVSREWLDTLSLINVSIIVFMIAYRTYINDYNYALVVQYIVLFSFCAISFSDFRRFAMFFIPNLIVTIYLYFGLNYGDPKHTTFFLGSAFILFFGLVHQLFQLNKGSKLTFTDTILDTYDRLVIVYNLKGELIYVNSYLNDFVNKEDSELLGDLWYSVRNVDFRRMLEIKKDIKEQIRNNKVIEEINEQIYSEIHKKERTINWTFKVMESQYLMAVGTDITEFLKQQEEINELSSVVRTVSNGVIITNEKGIITWVNDGFCNIMGYEKNELYGIRPSKIFEIPDFFKEEYEKMISKGPLLEQAFTAAHYNKEGKVVWLMIIATPIYNENGELQKIIEVVTDVTLQKEKDLEFERLSLVARYTQNPIFITDKNQKISYVNPSFISKFGYQEEEILQKYPPDLIFRDSIYDDTYDAFINKINNNQLTKGEFRLYNKRGEATWMNVTVDPIFDLEGNISQFICLLQSIQEIKEFQNVLQDKNKNILESITYAKRIQDAILPNLTFVKKTLPEYFMYYKPKDIVSGDFYYIEKINSRIYIGIGDCTGHGVPGALMTSIAIASLNNAIIENKLEDPAKILSSVDAFFKTSLYSDRGGVSDGMDIGMIVIDKESNKIEYSGAKRPLIVKEINEKPYLINGTKRSIGEYIEDPNKIFKTNIIDIKEGMLIYCFSDGLPDQFGGERYKKLYQRKFIDYLVKISTLPMKEQQNEISDFMKSWMNGYDQTDDMVLFGARFSI